NLVPRWRTMIIPALTCWPAPALTPRYLGLESRPFRDEPMPFLCAISYSASFAVVVFRVRRAGVFVSSVAPGFGFAAARFGFTAADCAGSFCAAGAASFFAVAFLAPIDSISICDSRLRWPLWRRYPDFGRYLPMRIFSPRTWPTTRAVTVTPFAP